MLTFINFIKENYRPRTSAALISKRKDIRDRSYALSNAIYDLEKTTDALRFAEIPVHSLIPLISGREKTIENMKERQRRLSLALDAIGPRIINNQKWVDRPPDEPL